MKIIKRNGSEADFDLNKIVVAVSKANAACRKEELTQSQIVEIAEYVEFKMSKANRALSVEEIQDIVENQIMAQGAFEVARLYVKYRYNRSLIRKANTTDNQILSLIECNNEEVKQENSNKNPTVNSVQRDYMAGEVSKDITKRILLPQDIVDAHEQGLIHFHDADYFAQHMHNCDLVNLEDMLQNGTVISETMIEKPHSFSTACNIATQIIAQVASSQYGGQSISLSHLAPFVDVSRKKIKKQVESEIAELGITMTEEQIVKLTEKGFVTRFQEVCKLFSIRLLLFSQLTDKHLLLLYLCILTRQKTSRKRRTLLLLLRKRLSREFRVLKTRTVFGLLRLFQSLFMFLRRIILRRVLLISTLQSLPLNVRLREWYPIISAKR